MRRCRESSPVSHLTFRFGRRQVGNSLLPDGRPLDGLPALAEHAELLDAFLLNGTRHDDRLRDHRSPEALDRRVAAELLHRHRLRVRIELLHDRGPELQHRSRVGLRSNELLRDERLRSNVRLGGDELLRHVRRRDEGLGSEQLPDGRRARLGDTDQTQTDAQQHHDESHS